MGDADIYNSGDDGSSVNDGCGSSRKVLKVIIIFSYLLSAVGETLLAAVEKEKVYSGDSGTKETGATVTCVLEKSKKTKIQELEKDGTRDER